MPIVDPDRLVGADTTGFHGFCEQPLPIPFQHGDPGRG